MLRHRSFVLQLALALLASLLWETPHGLAQDNAETTSPPPGTVWRVATKEVEPFAFKDQSGRWRGITVELINEIASALTLRVEWVECDSTNSMFSALRDQRADSAAAAISVTPERISAIDFSHPYYSAGPGVAVRAAGGQSEAARLFHGLTSAAFLELLISVVLLLLACGLTFWLVEKRNHPDYRDVSKRKGIGTGVWWSTIILFGHKGIYPKTVLGCVIAGTGMVASIVLLSVLTGAIASILTVGQLENPIESVSDLREVRTVTVPGTSASEFLRNHRVRFSPVDSVEAGLEAIDDDLADALVYDAPLLEYRVSRGHPQLRVIETPLEIEDYAIAFPLGSARRTPVNRALLEFRASEDWDQILFRYLGI